MKSIIKKILREEVNSGRHSLLRFVETKGILEASKMVGGFDTLSNALRGTDWLTRDNMIESINQVCQYFDDSFLLSEIGLDDILIYDEHDGQMYLSLVNYNFFEVDLIGKVIDRYDSYGYGSSLVGSDPVAKFPYNYKIHGEYLLHTNHLYEIVDGIMEYYFNNDNQLTDDDW